MARLPDEPVRVTAHGFRSWALTVAGVVACGAVTFAAIEFGELSRLEQRVDLQSSILHLNRTLDNADGAISQIRDTATKEEAQYDPKQPGSIPNQVYRLTQDAKTLIGRSDVSLNGKGDVGGLFSQLGRTLQSTADLSQHASTDLDATTQQLQPILVNLAGGSASFAQQAPPILANVLETSKQVAIITQHSADATSEVDMTAHDVRQVADAFRNDYLKPRNRLWLYLKTIIGLGAQAGDISKL